MFSLCLLSWLERLLTLSHFGPSCCHIKCSPDFTNIMTECPLANQATFLSPEREFVCGYAPRCAQLSVKSKQVLGRLLALLSSHLQSQLSTSCTSLISPALLLSICDVLRADSSVEQGDTSVLPFVLGKLRDWRLLDPNYRYSSAGVHKLALDLAGIADKASTSTSSDSSRTPYIRLRMKWVSLDSPSENLGGEPSQSTPASSSSWSSALELAQTCARVLADLNKCRSHAAHESSLVGRLSTPDSEDSGANGSRSSHAASGFRSGCSACRHPRVSGASTPPSPLLTPIGRRTPFGDANQFETHVSTSVVPSRRSKVTEQRATAKKSKKESNRSLQSTRDTVDENKPPSTGTNKAGMQGRVGVGISFPRQRTHLPRISNASLQEPVATAQRRVEPSRLPNRTREDKHMSSHRVASTSVDLVLPIARHAHSPRHASPIDLHRQPNRAQSLSSTSVTSHAVGSIPQNPKLSSNAVSRSGKLLPFWNQTYRCDPATTTTMTRSVVLKPDVSLPSPAKAHSHHALTRPWIAPRFPSDACAASPRPVSTHRHTQSTGSAFPSPRFTARKWQV